MTRRYYGIPSERSLMDCIMIACALMPVESFKDRVHFMTAIAYQETKFGKHKDKTKGAGEGVFQFDPSIIEDTIDRTRHVILDAYSHYFQVNFYEISHNKLRYMPLVSTILAVLKIYLAPWKIPERQIFQDQWKYYKQWYNSYDGAATEEEYLEAWNFANDMYQKYEEDIEKVFKQRIEDLS